MTRLLPYGLLFSLVSPALSLNLPFDITFPDFDTPNPVAAGKHPAITHAPSAAVVELRLLQARTLPSLLPCATSCFNSVATKSTNCKANDYECQCETVNANIIELGAYSCVQDGCGVYAAEGVWSVAADFCSSVNAGDYGSSDSTDDATSTEETSASTTGSVVVVTKTGDSGSAITSTVVVPHQTGSSGSSSGSSGSGSSSGSSGKSKSSALSKGAIAGIAVGAAGGAVIICAILFLIYRCVRKRPAYAAVAPADTSAATGNPPMSQAPPSNASPDAISGKPELDGKASALASTIPASPATFDTSGVSRHPSVVSNASPQPATAMPVAPAGHAPNYPPAMSELQAGAWQYGGQQQWHPSQIPPPGNGGPIPPQQPNAAQYEMTGQRPPELMGNSQVPQEMHGYSYNGGVYEMPVGRMS